MTGQVENRGRAVRIGGASGYWGDSQEAPRQLVLHSDIDYLVFDYLAEVTMSILVRAKEKNPDLGYARDFIELVMKPLISEIKAGGIRVVVNAGGVNVSACAQALAKVAEDAGVELKIGTVDGDNLVDRLAALKSAGVKEMFTGDAMPDAMVSANAYLGAFPIAAALDAGAEVVITGRCVDSAVTLGPLIHEFGWSADDFDRLAAGSLAGHIIECGAQATGGNFTDWRDTVDGWDNMGYPIAECHADGRFTITKPDDTGGLISPLTVGEQILYEIGDPSAYILPDVVCDFRHVALRQDGPNRLEISNVKGRPPTDTYKVSATYRDGFRATAMTIITGFDAVEKAQAFGDKLLKRTRRLFTERNLGDYRDTAVYVIGAQTLWGANADEHAATAREVMARIDVRHDDRAAMELFSKETTGVALSMSPGRVPGGAAGRPKVTPVVAQFAFLIAKNDVPTTVRVDGQDVVRPTAPSRYSDGAGLPLLADEAMIADDAEEMIDVQLIDLAVARSGDKGNNANIGVIARDPAYLPWIKASLTEDRVRQWFIHDVEGKVHRYDLPGMDALNFVLTECLGGGGTASTHLDSQGKTYGQQILAMPVRVLKSIGVAV